MHLYTQTHKMVSETPVLIYDCVVQVSELKDNILNENRTFLFANHIGL